MIQAISNLPSAYVAPSIDLGTQNKPAANPTAPSSGGSWGYSPATLPLFNTTGSPTPQDVVQGGIGDCFMLSDLQQLAAQNPQFIKDHIKEVPNPNDAQHPNYQVQLFDKDGKPQTVTVDGKQLLDSVSSPSGAGGNTEESWGQGPASALWPTIYEKAFAIANNENIDQLSAGGFPNDAWQPLTGQSGNAILGQMPSTAEFLAAASDSSNAQTLGTIGDMTSLPTWNGSSATLDNGRYTVTPNKDEKYVMHIVDNQSNEAWDLPTGHALPIMGVSTGSTTDDTLIRVNVANPWGPSLTNQQNLQDIPWAVLKEVGAKTFNLPIPGREQQLSSVGGVTSGTVEP